MFSHQYIHAPSLNMPTYNGLYRTRSSDRHARLSHQMSEATAEASARFLVRAVPLVYGALLGGLSDHLLLGLLIGFSVTVVLDLRLKIQSVARAWLQPVMRRFRVHLGKSTS